MYPKSGKPDALQRDRYKNKREALSVAAINNVLSKEDDREERYTLVECEKAPRNHGNQTDYETKYAPIPVRVPRMRVRSHLS